MAIIYGNAISIGYATSGSSVGGTYSIWLTLPVVAASTTFTAVKGDVSVESKYISSIKAAKITLPADNPEGDWTITGTAGGKTVSKTVTVKSGIVDYFVDFRNDFIPLVGDLAVGNLVTFDNKEWRVVHQEGTHWYLAAKDIYSLTSFSTGGLAYKNSTLANVAATYESEQLSDIAKEYCIDVTVENVTAKVFVPNYNWVNGGFEYYNSNTNRICNYNGSGRAWWMSDRYGTSDGIRYVYATGETTGSSTPTLGNGFRPHICIKYCPNGFDFTYTGTYNIRDDGVVELLTSGDFVISETTKLDAFLVGGGGAGNGSDNSGASAGGGGGYTKTLTKIILQQGTSYPISIGAGGAHSTSSTSYFGLGGGNTTAFGATVNGGQPTTSTGAGGNGGSGGGGTTKQGGSDGSNGLSSGAYIGGKGQGTTTREFGEPTGKLYAAGGGGGISDNTTTGIAGGDGGGGMGGTYAVNGQDGVANTGSGGGGKGSNKNLHAGSGGSGIVCIRLHKETSPITIPLTGDLAVGNTVTYDDKSFIVVHNEGTKWYLASSTIIENCTSTVLTTKCTEYLSNFSSTAQNYMVAQTIDSYTGKVFLPSRAQLNSGFTYYKNNANRICRYNGEASYWWALTSSSSGYNDSVDSDGAISSNHYSVTLGFRPHICIDPSLSGETITLAGTWMFNDPLSAPESLINEYINFTGKEMVTSTPRNFTGARISTTQFDATPTGALPIVVYKFAEKTWVNKYKYLTFPTDATASDEFITWLKANATKQS